MASKIEQVVTNFDDFAEIDSRKLDRNQSKTVFHTAGFPSLTLRICSDIGKNCAFAFPQDSLPVYRMRISYARACNFIGTNGATSKHNLPQPLEYSTSGCSWNVSNQRLSSA
jgi:hypothetical protein